MKKLIVIALLLATPAQADTITAYSYIGTNWTTNTDPVRFGTSMGGIVIFDFASFTTTGTFTLGHGISFLFLEDRFGSGNLLTSAQTPNPIDPASFVTLTNGVITDWSLTGAGNGGNGLVFMQSINGERDFIRCDVCVDTFALTEHASGTWQRLTAAPVPGPVVGSLGGIIRVFTALFAVK